MGLVEPDVTVIVAGLGIVSVIGAAVLVGKLIEPVVTIGVEGAVAGDNVRLPEEMSVRGAVDGRLKVVPERTNERVLTAAHGCG